MIRSAVIRTYCYLTNCQIHFVLHAANRSHSSEPAWEFNVKVVNVILSNYPLPHFAPVAGDQLKGLYPQDD